MPYRRFAWRCNYNRSEATQLKKMPFVIKQRKSVAQIAAYDKQESPNGMASASQADFCGFEPRLLLQINEKWRLSSPFFYFSSLDYVRLIGRMQLFLHLITFRLIGRYSYDIELIVYLHFFIRIIPSATARCRLAVSAPLV